MGQASIEQNEIALLRESLAAMEKENACLRRSINTPALSNGTELASVSMIDQNLRYAYLQNIIVFIAENRKGMTFRSMLLRIPKPSLLW